MSKTAESTGAPNALERYKKERHESKSMAANYTVIAHIARIAVLVSTGVTVLVTGANRLVAELSDGIATPKELILGTAAIVGLTSAYLLDRVASHASRHSAALTGAIASHELATPAEDPATADPPEATDR